MIPFSLETPRAIHFGDGTIEKLREIAAPFGDRILLVTGGRAGSRDRTGWGRSRSPPGLHGPAPSVPAGRALNCVPCPLHRGGRLLRAAGDRRGWRRRGHRHGQGPVRAPRSRRSGGEVPGRSPRGRRGPGAVHSLDSRANDGGNGSGGHEELGDQGGEPRREEEHALGAPPRPRGHRRSPAHPHPSARSDGDLGPGRSHAARGVLRDRRSPIHSSARSSKVHSVRCWGRCRPSRGTRPPST